MCGNRVTFVRARKFGGASPHEGGSKDKAIMDHSAPISAKLDKKSGASLEGSSKYFRDVLVGNDSACTFGWDF